MRYDYTKISQVLERTLEWLGEERFSKMRVTELEKMIRERETTTPLPSRSQFRAAIHDFRVKRWPEAVPRRRS
ncbi:hypothetical protein [Bradyrhizobium valentinum]|uniref:Uncharacterized protein n=1 Tax=Bradyrhizobium valentinum TaxID=1518501 RepID=A0A0R3KWZ1_9BRAD|nr:hypothetical protein [Bradyrhizobium valentinum]KRQ99309.1 hypothetical protein CP49_11985 [Bradyrhizobium valentinum]